jgi:hypothetical protein
VLVNISANPHKGTNFGIGHGLEEHYLLHLADRTSELTEKFQTTFSGQGGCRLLIHHETFPVGVYETMYGTDEHALNLCDVDPASIKIVKYDFHNDAFDCSEPEQVQLFHLNCNAAEIVFHTHNDVPAIIDDSVTTFPKLKGSEHELKTTSKTSTEYFTVDDDAYAQRLAAAFKHAVEVCGGRPSTF